MELQVFWKLPQFTPVTQPLSIFRSLTYVTQSVQYYSYLLPWRFNCSFSQYTVRNYKLFFVRSGFNYKKRPMSLVRDCPLGLFTLLSARNAFNFQRGTAYTIKLLYIHSAPNSKALCLQVFYIQYCQYTQFRAPVWTRVFIHLSSFSPCIFRGSCFFLESSSYRVFLA